ncbi:MAG: VanZ family protein, partial [Saprospiraceae bacterium]|nr:VanZ family protein [Saprospiraceae bacterium]
TIEQLMFWSAMAVFASVFVLSLTASRSRKSRLIRAGMVLGIAAVYAMAFLRFSSAADRTHLVEYSIVALLILEALRERSANGRPVPRAALLAFLLTAAIGVLDESLQLFMPNRVFDPIDMAFNCGAAGAAVLAAVGMTWARKRFAKGERASKGTE